MIALDGDVLRVTGAMRLAEAVSLRDAGLALIGSARSIDLSGVSEVDSAAIAVLLQPVQSVRSVVVLRT